MLSLSQSLVSAPTSTRNSSRMKLTVSRSTLVMVYALSPTLLSAPTLRTTSRLSNSFVATSSFAKPVKVTPAVSMSFCLSLMFTKQFRVPTLYVTM